MTGAVGKKEQIDRGVGGREADVHAVLPKDGHRRLVDGVTRHARTCCPLGRLFRGDHSGVHSSDDV